MCTSCKGAHRFIGQWVHCHSVYGWHRGVLTSVTPRGIVLSNAARLATYEPNAGTKIVHGIYKSREVDAEPAQFFGGLFVPFGGLFGIFPGFGFGFGGGFWW